MPTTDPMMRDDLAGAADLMDVYEKYGRTPEMARERGGEAFVRALCAELERIDDVYSQCKLLDQPVGEIAWETIFRIACPTRAPQPRLRF